MDGDVLDHLLSAAPVALLVTDSAGRCIHASARFAELVGGDPAGDRWMASVAAGDRRLVAGAVVRASARGEGATVHCRIVAGGSRERWVELELVPRIDSNGVAVGAIGVARVDVEAPLLISLDERTDPLTGAANEAGVLAHLGVVLAGDDMVNATGPGSVGVLVLDLDGFAEVNEHLGRLSGDELLGAVVGRLRGTVRFCDLVGVERVAARVLDTFVRPFRLDGGTVKLSGSVGVAVGDRSMGPEQVLAQAAAGLSAAQAAGGGCWRRVDGLRLVHTPQ
jgi:GGDEF domain-containing protein